jgi:nicotinate-nucleotide adenylyltransferase
VLAQEAAVQLGLRRVLLVPAREAPHKRIDPEPGPGVRLEMTRLAAIANHLLEASDVEVLRPGPSYTYETLELIHKRRRRPEIWLLMGADVAAHLEQWREPERVLELARVGIAARPGTVMDEAQAALERLGAADRATTVAMPELGVSSTSIRRRIAERRPIRYVVPDGVLEFIEAQRLYRDSDG